MGKKPKKPEIAQMILLNDMGTSSNSIGQKLSRSHHTVAKYVQSPAYRDDPEIQALLKTLREKEYADLTILGEKARMRLHELLYEGNTKVIETLALADRTFHMRRLLSGKSTANIAVANITDEDKERLKDLAKKFTDMRLQESRKLAEDDLKIQQRQSEMGMQKRGVKLKLN